MRYVERIGFLIDKNTNNMKKHVSTWSSLWQLMIKHAHRSLSVASDGSLVCAANDKGTCYVWRVMRNAPPGANFDPLYKLRAHDCTLLECCSQVLCKFHHRCTTAYILKCLISPDVRQLATASSDKTIKLWNLDTFALDRTLTGMERQLSAVGLLHHHTLCTGHQRWVWDCVFSVDAAYLVSASSDCTARLWDLSTGEAIRMYTGHHKACVCCALNDSAIDGREDG